MSTEPNRQRFRLQASEQSNNDERSAAADSLRACASSRVQGSVRACASGCWCAGLVQQQGREQRNNRTRTNSSMADGGVGQTLWRQNRAGRRGISPGIGRAAHRDDAGVVDHARGRPCHHGGRKLRKTAPPEAEDVGAEVILELFRFDLDVEK